MNKHLLLPVMSVILSLECNPIKSFFGNKKKKQEQVQKVKEEAEQQALLAKLNEEGKKSAQLEKNLTSEFKEKLGFSNQKKALLVLKPVEEWEDEDEPELTEESVKKLIAAIKEIMNQEVNTPEQLLSVYKAFDNIFLDTDSLVNNEKLGDALFELFDSNDNPLKKATRNFIIDKLNSRFLTSDQKNEWKKTAKKVLGDLNHKDLQDYDDEAGFGFNEDFGLAEAIQDDKRTTTKTQEETAEGNLAKNGTAKNGQLKVPERNPAVSSKSVQGDSTGQSKQVSNDSSQEILEARKEAEARKALDRHNSDGDSDRNIDDGGKR
jgi:hypothetical protein